MTTIGCLPTSTQEKPRILYVRPTTDPRGPSNPSPALTVLRGLASSKFIELRERSSLDIHPSLLYEDIDQYHSVIARPTRVGNSLGEVSSEKLSNRFVIGSISSDPSKKLSFLCRPSTLEVQHSKLSLNAESVADLVLWFALTTFRPFAAAVQGMALSQELKNPNIENHERFHLRIHDIEGTTTLAKKTWTFIGMGTQPELLLLRVASLGIDNVAVYYNPAVVFDDEAWRNKLFKFVESALGLHYGKKDFSHEDPSDGFRAKVIIPYSWGRRLSISITDDLDLALRSCDIASIHVPYIGPGKPRSTHYLINGNHVLNMRPNSLLINAARQLVWDERTILQEAKKRNISLASDLLHPTCEGNELISIDRSHFLSETYHPHTGGLNPSGRIFDLGERFISTKAEDACPKRLFTPHIGGATADMYAIECEVVGKVLTALSRQFPILSGAIEHSLQVLLDEIPEKFRHRYNPDGDLDQNIFAVCESESSKS